MDGTVLRLIPSELVSVISQLSQPNSLVSLRSSGLITEDMFQKEMYQVCVELLNDNDNFKITEYAEECDYYLVYRYLEYTPEIKMTELIDAFEILSEKSKECLYRTLTYIRSVMFNVPRFIEVMLTLFSNLSSSTSYLLIGEAIKFVRSSDNFTINRRIILHICEY